MKRLLSFLLLLVFYSLHAHDRDKINYYDQGKNQSFLVTSTGLTKPGLVNAFNALHTAIGSFFCSVEIEADGPTRFCPGGSVTLSVKNPVVGTSYQWRKDGANTSTGTTITANASGSYDVVATDVDACVATSAAIVVTALSNTPPLTANAGVDTFICLSQSVKLGGNPVAKDGAPWLADKRVYGMDWASNSFVKFDLANPALLETITTNVASDEDFSAGNFFTGADFTPYGYYAITPVGNQLIKVDTATGSQELIGEADAPDRLQWSGLAWDPVTKNLFGLATNGSTSSICIIDPFTANVTQVASIAVGNIEWVAVNNDGGMYVLADNDYVYSIDKVTGAATALSLSAGADIIGHQDADFDPVSDKLYLTAFIQDQTDGDWRTVDTITGVSTVIGTLGSGGAQIDATAIAGPGYQYNWSPADGLNSTDVSVPVATPLTTTTYTLTVTDMCGNTATDQVTVTVNTAPTVEITAPTDNVCVGETVRLSATKDDSYTYQWFRNTIAIDGATDSFYVASKGGDYTVSAKRTGCETLSDPYTVSTCELRMDSDDPAAVCNTYFFDSGGDDNNYGDFETYTRTITSSTAGSVPRLTLNSFHTEAGQDVLTIYDGPDASAPVLATLSGAPAMPLTFTGTNGALTIKFESNDGLNDSGYSGIIDCVQPNVYRSKASGNAEDISTWEVGTGGSFTDAIAIPHLYDDSIIVQTGHTVTINTAVQLDQIFVQPGGTLNIAAQLTLNDGAGNDLQADGTLVIGAAGSIIGNGIVTLKGDLDNSASAVSTVSVRTEITGSNPQTVTASGNFGTLYISNPSVAFNVANDIAVDSVIMDAAAGVVTVTAIDPLTLLNVNKYLSLQNGRLIMGNNAVLNLYADASIDGASTTSFVEGPFRSSTMTDGFSTLFFPVGATVYRPVTLNVTHSSAGLSTYEAEVFNTAATPRTLPSTIDAVSGKRHFKISNIVSQPLTDAVATLTYGTDDGVSDPSSLRMAKDDGAGNWIDLGGSGSAVGEGTITSTVNFTSFSDFVLSNSLNGANNLPVKWLQVSAKIVSKEVQVSWKIANEINVSNYIVEHSVDGRSFSTVATVNATASSTAEKQYAATDKQPQKGVNYYRIRQTDKDGKYSYSKTVLINFSEAGTLLLWPNPATEKITVQNTQSIQRLQFYNSNGQLIYDVSPSANQATIPVQKWAAGIYHIKITSEGKVTEARFIKQ